MNNLVNLEPELPADQADSGGNGSSRDGRSDSVAIILPRAVFGGALMGLANLVPGISGGTMLLAAGIYPKFINAISDISRLRLRFQSILVLGSVVAAACLAILLGAGLLKDLVVSHRWVMYSIFIGLTLGGVPLVWKLGRPVSPSLIISAIFGFGAMAALSILQAFNVVGTSENSFLMSLVAGLAGASAMILPGLSGGYILLLLGQYIPILSAISEFKNAIEARDFSAAMDPALTVMLPVGIGVILGVVVVGNLVQWFLTHYRKPTLGLLLGLLLGSIIGLWPFQQAIQPSLGETVKGRQVTEENINDFDPEDWPTQFFYPAVSEFAGALALVVAGFGLTMGVSKIGGDDE